MLSRYANFLRAVYATSPVARADKFPPTPSKVYIRLALVKKEVVSRVDADKFTCLTLKGDIDQILQVKEPIEMDEILKVDDTTRLVVVEGAPGIGKSTLAWELCRQWPALDSLKRFSLVILHRLRETGVQSATKIRDLFPCEDDPELSSLVAQQVRRLNGEGVLLVFDGFDELPSSFRKTLDSLVMRIIAGEILPRVTVLVTSRPSATADLQSVFQTAISKHVEVVGFSGKEIDDYVKSIFGSKPETMASFNSYLSVNPVVKGMMYNPLNCTIIVGVYQETAESGKPVPHTQTQLYTELTLCLLCRHLGAKGDPLAKMLPDRLEDLPREGDLYLQLVKVGKLAFEGRLREVVIFKTLPEGCSDLGLLVEHTALYTRKETSTFNFFHLTLQEYMCAFYFSQLPPTEQKTLFTEYSDSERMNVAWRFAAGLTQMKNIGWDVVKRLVIESDYLSEVEDDEALTVKGSVVEEIGPHVVEDDCKVLVNPFLIQCLYEARDIQSCKSVFTHQCVVLDTEDVQIMSGLSNYACYALGYCISVHNNTWNLDMPGTPGEGLEMLGHGMKCVDYGGGLVDGLNLHFCKGIMNEVKHFLQMPHEILMHIKSLNLMECDIDQAGFENLAECIPYLTSLISLDVSSNPGSTAKLLQALKRHGKLQNLDMQHTLGSRDDVVALLDLVQPPSCLRVLSVSSKVNADQSAPQEGLTKSVLSQSSLDTLKIQLTSSDESPLDYIETISASITNLELNSSTSECPTSSPHQPLDQSSTKSSRVKGGTKLSRILRENTSLKDLKLNIPLDREEVRDIVCSLEDNHSLEKLELSTQYHSKYLSEHETKELDSRIHLENNDF